MKTVTLHVATWNQLPARYRRTVLGVRTALVNGEWCVVILVDHNGKKVA